MKILIITFNNHMTNSCHKADQYYSMEILWYLYDLCIAIIFFSQALTLGQTPCCLRGQKSNWTPPALCSSPWTLVMLADQNYQTIWRYPILLTFIHSHIFIYKFTPYPNHIYHIFKCFLKFKFHLFIIWSYIGL